MLVVALDAKTQAQLDTCRQLSHCAQNLTPRDATCPLSKRFLRAQLFSNPIRRTKDRILMYFFIVAVLVVVPGVVVVVARCDISRSAFFHLKTLPFLAPRPFCQER